MNCQLSPKVGIGNRTEKMKNFRCGYFWGKGYKNLGQMCFSIILSIPKNLISWNCDTSSSQPDKDRVSRTNAWIVLRHFVETLLASVENKLQSNEEVTKTCFQAQACQVDIDDILGLLFLYCQISFEFLMPFFGCHRMMLDPKRDRSSSTV